MSLQPVIDEKELLLRLQKGDHAAFEQLYKHHKERLASNLLYLLKSEDLAADVLQELFVKVWDNRQSIVPERSFGAYLFKVAQNMVVDIYRRSARDKQLTARLLEAATDWHSPLDEEYLQEEKLSLLRSAIDQLPPQRKKVFVMCKIEGKSYREVTEELGISKSSINEHITLANQFLKNYLAKKSSLTISLIAFLLAGR